MEVFMTQLHLSLFIVVLLILMNFIDGQYTVCVTEIKFMQIFEVEIKSMKTAKINVLKNFPAVAIATVVTNAINYINSFLWKI